MSKRITLGTIDSIPPGEGRTFEADGTAVTVFRTRSGSIHATEALCPHKKGPLADGIVGAKSVVCPLHERVFDLTTGECTDGSCRISVFPTSQEGESVVVDLP